jgi:hypothetical protein
MRDELIDREEFPFTETELCAALALVQDAAHARRQSAEHAAGMRVAAASLAEFHARVAAAKTAPGAGAMGSSFGHSVYMWYPAEALALLTLVDAGLAERVRAHRLARRLADRPRRERQAVWRVTGMVDVPVPPDVAAALDAEDAAAELAWEKIVRKMTRRVAKARRAGLDVET